MTGAYRKTVFAVIFVALLIGSMQMINGWQMDMVTLSSIPVILSAEFLVLGMLYATIYHGMEHEVVEVVKPAEMKPQAKVTDSMSDERRAA